MEANPEHAGIRASGCSSLEHMALNQVDQHANGGVGNGNVIVDAIKLLIDDNTVQEAACLVLGSLALPGHGAPVQHAPVGWLILAMVL